MCQQCLYSSWCIFPQRLGCISYISFSFVEILHEKIRIISTQVVKDHWTNFGFLKLRSHLLWATPRYFSVKWQWSLTLSSSPSLNFSLQIQQIFEFLKCFMSASVKTTSFRKSNSSRIILNYSTKVLTKIWAQSSSLLFVLRITGSCLNNFLSKQTTWKQKPHGLCCWY